MVATMKMKLVGVYEIPHFKISVGDRGTRRKAWSMIFDELGAVTITHRLRIARAVKAALQFTMHPALSGRQRTISEANKWCDEVAKQSSELADLLRDPDAHILLEFIYDDRGTALLEQLEQLEAVALRMRQEPKAGRPPALKRQARLYLLVDDLGRLYQAATNSRAGAGRRNDHGAIKSKQHGKPDGPFFRIVKAALALANDSTSDEAILDAIQRRSCT
jgi:hypothetical protein